MKVNVQPGQQIIKEVLTKWKIGEYDFFNAKHRPKYLAAARKEATRRIHDELGYSSRMIGKIMRRRPSTIRSFLSGKNARQAAERTHKLVLRHLDPSARDVIEAVAHAERVTVEVLIAQWVGERATYEAQAKREMCA